MCLMLKISNGLNLVEMFPHYEQRCSLVWILPRQLIFLTGMNIQAVQSLLGQTQKYSIQEVKNIDSKEFIKNFLAKLELN